MLVYLELVQEMDFSTASTKLHHSSASIRFYTGIDSTYKEYIFYFVNIHPGW